MNLLSVIFQRETKHWCFSSVTYSFCALFSFFALAAMFLLSSFIEANESELTYSFFRWHPWILAVTAPVIGMRVWSEESSCGFFEVMGTQPIRMSQWVVAKFASACLVVVLALLCTLPAVGTTLWLGNPDVGEILAGYCGSFLCACAFVAISQAVSSIMRISIGAFVCSVGVCLLLVISGIPQIADFILGTFPQLEWTIAVLNGVSALTKFNAFAEGRIELGAVLGFLWLIAISLAINLRALLVQRGATMLWSRQILALPERLLQRRVTRPGFRSKAGNSASPLFPYGLPAPLLVAAYLIVAPIISQVPGMLDMTETQQYNFPDELAAELAELENDAIVRVFATTNHPEFGFDLVQYLRRIRETLSLLTKVSDNRVKVEFLNPNADARAARIAAIDEVKSLNYGDSGSFMFGMVVESANRKRIFDSLTPQRSNHFMTDTVQAVLDVGTADKSSVGIITPFDATSSDGVSLINWTGITVLSGSYNLRYVEHPSDLEALDIVILLHPSTLDVALDAALSDFLKTGGNIVVLADPNSVMVQNFASSSASLEFSRLPNFVLERGVSMAVQSEVYDLQLITRRDTTFGISDEPTLLTLGTEQFNANEAITAGFDFVHFVNAGALIIDANPSYMATTLLQSSVEAMLLNTELSLQADQRRIDSALGNLQTRKSGFPLMVLVRRADQANGEKNTEGQLVIASDVDWLFGEVAGYKNADGSVQENNSNLGLMRNVIDYLAGADALQDLRSRSLAKRPLSQWDEIKQSITERYRQPVASLNTDIGDLETKLDRLQQSRRMSVDQKQLASRVERQVSQLSNELRLKRAELASIRSERQKRIQRYLSVITWLSILFVPLLVSGAGFAIMHRRAKAIQS